MITNALRRIVGKKQARAIFSVSERIQKTLLVIWQGKKFGQIVSYHLPRCAEVKGFLPAEHRDKTSPDFTLGKGIHFQMYRG